MKFQVIEEKENPMLKRKEVLISLDYEKGSTPSKAELQKVLSEQFNANIENIEISKILSETGLSKGKSWIKIWQEKKVPIYSEIKKEEPESVPEKVEEVIEEPEEKKAKEEKPEEKVEEAPKEEPKKEPEKQEEQKSEQ
jgi:ribosomal protein S24E